MEKLLISKCNIQSVPESYILPPESRPGEQAFSKCEAIPIIDLGSGKGSQDRTRIVQQIMKASREVGFFQLINHGVSEKLMEEVLKVGKELFELPEEDKASLYSEDPNRTCKMFTGVNYAKQKVRYWKDSLRHLCHPLEEQMQSWPQKPARYKEVAGSYSVQVRKLMLWLLDAISEGLGLELGFFGYELSQDQAMSINNYPPCPHPSLTLGMPKHTDPNLMTLIGDHVHHGLQVLVDGEWLAVEPLPRAFVVNTGHMLQIISNGKITCADHRVVTCLNVSRTTVITAIHPCNNARIEPAKELVNESNPPLYKPLIYKEFRSTFMVDTYNGVHALERYTLQQC